MNDLLEQVADDLCTHYSRCAEKENSNVIDFYIITALIRESLIETIIEIHSGFMLDLYCINDAPGTTILLNQSINWYS